MTQPERMYRPAAVAVHVSQNVQELSLLLATEQARTDYAYELLAAAEERVAELEASVSQLMAPQEGNGEMKDGCSVNTGASSGTGEVNAEPSTKLPSRSTKNGSTSVISIPVDDGS